MDITSGTLSFRGAYEKKANEKREQRKEALKLLDEERASREKALDAIGEAAKTLIACSEDKENVSEAAVAALTQAEAGLRSLSIVMRQAAQFWKHMEVSITSNAVLVSSPDVQMGERTYGHYRQDSIPLRNAAYAMMS